MPPCTTPRPSRRSAKRPPGGPHPLPEPAHDVVAHQNGQPHGLPTTRITPNDVSHPYRLTPDDGEHFRTHGGALPVACPGGAPPHARLAGGCDAMQRNLVLSGDTDPFEQSSWSVFAVTAGTATCCASWPQRPNHFDARTSPPESPAAPASGSQTASSTGHSHGSAAKGWSDTSMTGKVTRSTSSPRKGRHTPTGSISWSSFSPSVNTQARTHSHHVPERHRRSVRHVNAVVTHPPGTTANRAEPGSHGSSQLAGADKEADHPQRSESADV